MHTAFRKIGQQRKCTYKHTHRWLINIVSISKPVKKHCNIIRERCRAVNSSPQVANQDACTDTPRAHSLCYLSRIFPLAAGYFPVTGTVWSFNPSLKSLKSFFFFSSPPKKRQFDWTTWGTFSGWDPTTHAHTPSPQVFAQPLKNRFSLTRMTQE